MTDKQKLLDNARRIEPIVTLACALMSRQGMYETDLFDITLALVQEFDLTSEDSARFCGMLREAHHGET